MADIIPFKKQLALLKAQPFFAKMEESYLSELVHLMQKVEFEEEQIVVVEGDIVDSFFLIAEGRVEVSKNKLTESKKGLTQVKNYVIATLHQGEAIGLSPTGFFSQTGARTATVMATERTILLKINLLDYEEFLERHPNLLAQVQQATTMMLHMNFIKQLLSFSSLAFEDIKYLAEQVREINVVKNTVIFSQNEMGTDAYLLKDGSIDIISVNIDGTETILTTLQAPNLFGEAAMLLETPRSATARARTDCKLLILNRSHVHKLHEYKSPAIKNLMPLIIERSRPSRLPGVIVEKHQGSDQEISYVLHDSEYHKYYNLSEMGLYLWNLLDGVKSLRDVNVIFYQHYPDASKNVLTELLFDLALSGFIEIHGLRIPEQNIETKPIEAKIADSIASIMEAKYIITNTDSAFSKIYNRLSFLYSPVMAILLSLIVLSGLGLFIWHGSDVISKLHSWSVSQFIIVMIVIDIILLPIVFMHTLLHALMTKHYRRNVNGVGFGWYWFGPTAYCDTTDMWLGTNKQRAMVNVAGIFSDLIWVGMLGWLAFLLPEPQLQAFCWLFAVVILTMTLVSLNPILEFDGYYILSDVMNENDLREKAIVWLTDDLPHVFTNLKKVFSENLHLLLFWLLCLLHLIISVLVAWFIQKCILGIFFPILAQPVWSWFLPSIVVLLALYGSRNEIDSVLNREK